MASVRAAASAARVNVLIRHGAPAGVHPGRADDTTKVEPSLPEESIFARALQITPTTERAESLARTWPAMTKNDGSAGTPGCLPVGIAVLRPEVTN